MENNKQVVKYSVNEAEIAKMGDIYMHLTIDDLDDKKQFEMVHSARMVMVGHRVAIEKRRKELKADALDWGRKVDGRAKELVGLLFTIEAHLIAEEKPVIEKEKRIKTEKEEAQRVITQNRVESLQAVGLVVSFDQAGSYTVNDFLRILETETKRFEAEKELLAKEEADRKEAIALLEKTRKAQEAEAERLREKVEKMRVEQKEHDDKQEALRVEAAAETRRVIAAGAERLKIAQKKIDEEKAELEADKKAEADRKQAADKAEVEKFLADEKAVLVEADRKQRVIDEEQAKIDKKKADEKEKKRQEALRPDVEKLQAFGNELLAIRGPELSDQKLKDYLEGALDDIYQIADNMIDDFDL